MNKPNKPNKLNITKDFKKKLENLYSNTNRLLENKKVNIIKNNIHKKVQEQKNVILKNNLEETYEIKKNNPIIITIKINSYYEVLSYTIIFIFSIFLSLRIMYILFLL